MMLDAIDKRWLAVCNLKALVNRFRESLAAHPFAMQFVKWTA